MGPQTPRKPLRKANSNRSPRYSVGPRIAANRAKSSTEAGLAVSPGGGWLPALRPAVVLAQPGLDLRDSVAVQAGRVDVRQAASLLDLDPAWRDAQVLGEALLGDPGLRRGLVVACLAGWPHETRRLPECGLRDRVRNKAIIPNYGPVANWAAVCREVR